MSDAQTLSPSLAHHCSSSTRTQLSNTYTRCSGLAHLISSLVHAFCHVLPLTVYVCVCMRALRRYAAYLSSQRGSIPPVYECLTDEQPDSTTDLTPVDTQPTRTKRTPVAASKPQAPAAAKAASASGPSQASVQAAVEGALVEVLGSALPATQPLMSGETTDHT